MNPIEQLKSLGYDYTPTGFFKVTKQDGALSAILSADMELDLNLALDVINSVKAKGYIVQQIEESEYEALAKTAQDNPKVVNSFFTQ